MTSLTPKAYVFGLTAAEIEQRLNSLDNFIQKDEIRQSLSSPSAVTIPSTQAVADALDPIQTQLQSLGDLAGKDSVSLDSEETVGVLPLNKGGTGGNTVELARQNLGILTQDEIQNLINESVAEIGSVDLSSPQVTNVLPMVKGGTGADTPSRARANLGVWSSVQSEVVKTNTKEALRRSYAEAGYNLVDGSFEEGGTLSSTVDVLLHQATGVAYTGPIGTVPPGTDPTLPSSGYVPRTDAVLRAEINVVQRRFSTVAEMKSKLTFDDVGKVVEWVGYYSAFDGGGNKGIVVATGTGVDDGGSFFDCASGVQIQAYFGGAPTLSKFGAKPDNSTDCKNQLAKFSAYIDGSSGVIDGKFYFSGNATFSNTILIGKECSELRGASSSVLTIANSELQHIDCNVATLKHGSGKVIIYRCKLHDTQAQTQAMLIPSNLTGTGNTLDILFCEFRNNNYGVLRQGSAGSGLERVSIFGCEFYDHEGDPIEFNLCWNDRKIRVSNILIDGVGATATNTNWGIGIGFAGSGSYSYNADGSINYDDGYFAQDIIVEHVVVKGCRQPIHFEKSRDFIVRDVVCYPDPTVATTTGIALGACFIYGSADFLIEDFYFDGPGDIGIRWAVVNSTYKAPCVDYTLRGIKGKGGGGVSLYSWGKGKVCLENIEVTDGNFSYRGQVRDLNLSNISVEGGTLEVSIKHTTGEGVGILPEVYPSNCSISNVHGYDSNGVASASASNFYVDKLLMSNTNVPAVKSTQFAGFRGALLQSANLIFNLESGGVPYGVEFKRGDVLINQTGISVITAGGSRTNEADSIKATTVGQTYIESNGLDWSTGYYKSVGNKITIPGAGVGGAPLQTTVTRATYVANSLYRCNIADAIVTATPRGTVIKSTNTVAYTTILSV